MEIPLFLPQFVAVHVWYKHTAPRSWRSHTPLNQSFFKVYFFPFPKETTGSFTIFLHHHFLTTCREICSWYEAVFLALLRSCQDSDYPIPTHPILSHPVLSHSVSGISSTSSLFNVHSLQFTSMGKLFKGEEITHSCVLILLLKMIFNCQQCITNAAIKKQH